MNRRKIIKGLAYFFILFVFVYTLMIFLGETRENIDVLKGFNWIYIPAILVLVLINFLLRELKWDFFRRKADIVWEKPIPRFGSWLIFFSGYSMCISPGRLGEVIKPALYKEYYNSPLKKAVPLVFCERLTDLLGMVVMCLLTIGFYLRDVSGVISDEGLTDGHLIIGFILSIGLLVGVIGVARWRSFIMTVFDKFGSVPKLSGPFDKLKGLYESTFPLLTFFNLSSMALFAAFSWFFECLAMYVICMGLEIDSYFHGGPVTLFHCMFIFCISSILGAFAFIFPGGMGPVELLMVVLLRGLGVAASAANACMMLTRFCTLFFGAALGFFFLWLTARYHKDNNLWEHLNEAIEEDEPETAT